MEDIENGMLPQFHGTNAIATVIETMAADSNNQHPSGSINKVV